MIGRLKLGITAIAAALVLAPALPQGQLQAQEDLARFRVLVPTLFPLQGADDNFGEDVAKEIRDLINQLPTHQPVERDDLRDNLRRFDLDMKDLNCLRLRQLGSQMNVQVALCASYTESGDQRAFQEIKFVDLQASQEFPVETFTIHKDRKEEAAQRIVEAFDTYVQADRHRQFCFDYANSSDWEGSLRNCDTALEYNPSDTGVMYQRAFTLWKMDRLEDALAQLEALFELEPYHDDGLQLGGFLATTLGQEEDGRQYYSKYLELNPGAISIRRNIAFDLYEAGDPEGAMILIREGLEGIDDPDAGLLADFASYAFAAAREMIPEGAQQGAEETEIPPEAAQLFREGIDAYEQVYATRGDSMSVSALRNVISGHAQLGELAEAEAFAQRVLETHPEEPTLWSTYSTVLERQGKVDEAVEALQRIESLDPDYQNLFVRQANLLLQAGERERALPMFERAVERGEDPTRVARVIFADAYAKGIDPQNSSRNLQYGIQGLQAAKQYEVNAETQAMLDFWHGYTLYQMGMAAAEPQNLENARRSLPMFEQARQLFQAGSAYADTQPSININQFVQAASQYIEIQEAIIRRGGR